jgi:hypothetical protein
VACHPQWLSQPNSTRYMDHVLLPTLTAAIRNTPTWVLGAGADQLTLERTIGRAEREGSSLVVGVFDDNTRNQRPRAVATLGFGGGQFALSSHRCDDADRDFFWSVR